MVVDDEPTIRNLLNDLLAEEGYEVILASDGKEAINLAETEDPGVILLDINMPGVNGLEVCQKLKELDKTKYIPIIIVTALADRGFMAYLEGADDFVTKPFNNIELTFRIRSMLRIRQLNVRLQLSLAYINQLENDLSELQLSGGK